MTLVIDTSVLINIEKGNQQTIHQLKSLRELYPSPARITFINEMEFLFGIKERLPKNQEKALAFLNNFSVFHTTPWTSSILADLKYNYEKKGITLPLADLLIASLVVENNGVLVTTDRDFDKIEEVKKVII